jgi:hypothetical protein
VTGFLTAKQLAEKFPLANLSALPTSNPGGGKPWLSGGAVVVGNYAGNTVDWSAIANKPTEFNPTAHAHDDRYYTKSEIDAGYAKLSGGNTFTGNQTVNGNLTFPVAGLSTGGFFSSSLWRSIRWTAATSGAPFELANCGLEMSSANAGVWFANVSTTGGAPRIVPSGNGLRIASDLTEIRNRLDSALGPLSCGAITCGSVGSSANTFLLDANSGALRLWTDVWLSRASTGVAQVGTNWNNASGGLNLANLNATGTTTLGTTVNSFPLTVSCGVWGWLNIGSVTGPARAVIQTTSSSTGIEITGAGSAPVYLQNGLGRVLVGQITDDGTSRVQVNGAITSSGTSRFSSVEIPGNGSVYFRNVANTVTTAAFSAANAGKLLVTNTSGTIGTMLDTSVDGVLSLRNRADDSFAWLRAGGSSQSITLRNGGNGPVVQFDGATGCSLRIGASGSAQELYMYSLSGLRAQFAAVVALGLGGAIQNPQVNLVPSADTLTIRNAADSALGGLVCGLVTSTFRSLSANPTTLDIASGLEQLVKNTTNGELRRWCNDGGSMKSILYA